MNKIIRSSVLAGICIGIAGMGFLAEKNIIGEVLFAFGLLAVVHYQLKLYTGTAGFIRKHEFGQLILILLGNILGCIILSLLTRCSPMPLQDTAQGILESRLSTGAIKCGILAIGCGFIMTTAVKFAREGKFYPLFFGVPLFIVCGFPHCVADAYYYCCVSLSFWAEHWMEILPLYILIVTGNFIGCNLSRWVLPEKKEHHKRNYTDVRRKPRKNKPNAKTTERA